MDCIGCSATLPAELRRGPRRKWCSNCRPARSSRQPAAPRFCAAGCGRTIPLSGNRGRPASRCATCAAPRAYLLRCRSCDGPMVTTRANAKYCSAECKQAINEWSRKAPCAGSCGRLIFITSTSLSPGKATCRACRRLKRAGRPRKQGGLVVKTCAHCEVLFEGRGQQRFCSRFCANRAGSHDGQLLSREEAAARRATRSLAKSRARNLRRALSWDGVPDAEIYERDRWICGICRRKIGKAFRHPHARSKSIDHIVPLSEGGDDTAANKRAAHLTCNMARSNKGGNEQLALLGSLADPPLPSRRCGSMPEPRGRPLGVR